MNKSPVVIGSDHAAYQLKEKIKKFLIENGIAVEDAGAQGEGSVDYPDYGIKVASLVSAGKFDRGILICGTGIGMSIVANRFSNVRAALCNDLFSAIMSRRHNNSNVLVMGGRVIGDVLAIEILKAWLETPFEGGGIRQGLINLTRWAETLETTNKDHIQIPEPFLPTDWAKNQNINLKGSES